MKKKICVVTGSRAEYGLLYWLIKGIQDEVDFDLQLIATGSHLSLEFGNTYQEIERDFVINKKIEILLSSDSDVAVTKSMGLALISFAEAYNDLKPDAVLVLGDRFEILSATTAAMVANIPIIHLHGGETTEGAIDESIRHAITKMSHLHFVAATTYRQRVIQLGEQPNRVYNVGGLGIDNIKKIPLLTQEDFEESIQFKLAKKNLLVTFHPVTLEQNKSQEQFQALLDALDGLEETNIIFTKANADAEGRLINQMIDAYVLEKNNTVVFHSLGQLRYLSALQYIDAVVGNSSSGLIEAPAFKIGTINIGNRQKGRLKADSIIDCHATKKSISNAFDKLYSNAFEQLLKTTKNPYGEGGATAQILTILKELNWEGILKKSFYDLPQN